MSHIRRSAYILMLLVAAASITAMVWRPKPPEKFVGLSSSDVPAKVGAFTSQGDYEMAPEVQAALAAGTLLGRTYSDGTNTLDFVMIGGTDRSALHDPRGCLVIGTGGRLEDDHSELLPGTQVAARSCRVVGGKDGVDFDVLYLYVVDGRVINQVTEIRAGMLWSALVGKKDRPVYFLRFMQPVSSDPDAASESHKRLARFAGQMWDDIGPRLVRGAQ